MKILGLLLITHRLAEQQDFYVRTLNLPLVEEMGSAFAVQAGDTKLVFSQADAGMQPSYYFAFNVAEGQFAAIKDQLSRRVTLLTRQGQEVFESLAQKARAVYCVDPANNLLAFVAQRRSLDQEAISLNPLNVLGVGEVGMAVDDVNSIAQVLQSSVGGSVSADNPDQNAAIGDGQGKFVLVKRGQPWFPTDHLRAEVYPLYITMPGTLYVTDKPTDYPYYVQTAKTLSSVRST